MTGDRRLYVRGYRAGFSNQRMSLDIAVGLAHVTGRTLVPFDFELPEVRYRGQVHPTLFDLFDIPVPWSPAHVHHRDVARAGLRRADWKPVFNSAFAYPDIPPPSDDRFRAFCGGRQHVNTFTEEDDDADGLVVDTRTLGHYSYFFYFAEDAHRRSLIDLMRKVRPKREYRELADRVVGAIGPFNAVHVRRRDFVGLKFTPRAATVSGDEVADVLSAWFDPYLPLAICTDEPDDAKFFAPIRARFTEAFFVDQLLRDAHGPDLAALPFAEEPVIAMLTQLVAARADRFVGTLFSTYTGIIHRLRGFAGHDDGFRYCYNDFDNPLVHFEDGLYAEIADGPFSWNRLHLPVLSTQRSWLREWPEAYTVGNDREPAPAARVLTAGSATVLGPTARVQGPGEPCVAWWTDPSDSVEWTLDPPLDGAHRVEIRYACPDATAGSAFEVEIGDTARLSGSVIGTGAFEVPSPWLRIGTVALTTEDVRVRVRITNLASQAAMNLYGLRLVADHPPATDDAEPPSWSSAMNGQQARRDMVRRLASGLTFAAAVETGTFHGHTTGFLADVLGCDVWSVELNPDWAAAAAQRLDGRAELHLTCGDSRALISALAPALHAARTFFYLDAHLHQDLPLWGEVELVLGQWADPIILIDDFAVPGDTGYGRDDWGPGQVLDLDHLAPLIPDGYSCWFPTTPSARETGWRRGCVVIARDEHAPLLRTCALRRVQGVRRADRPAENPWVAAYQQLNRSFEPVCVYRVGSRWGFFSEFNNLILAVLYCLQQKIRLSISTNDSNLGVRRGLADCVLPFCEMDDDPRHVFINGRPEHLRPETAEVAERFKVEHGIEFFTQDIWRHFRSPEFKQGRFDVPSLGLYGDLFQAASTVVRALWRLQPDVRDRVAALVEGLALPPEYVGFHIRRGDKVELEMPAVDLKAYFRAAEGRTSIRTALLATDDYAVVEEVRANFPDWTIATLCREDDRGHWQPTFNQRDREKRYHDIVRLLADVEALHGAQHLFVTYSSNIGAFLALRRGSRERGEIESVDIPEWTIL